MHWSRKGRQDVALLTVCLMLAMPAGSALAQPAATSDDMVNRLAGLDASTEVDIPSLRQEALARIKSKADAVALKRPPIAPQLMKLPHLDLDIQFNPGSPVIRPDSYRMLGRVADALSDPRLLPFGFLIVGHTDASGPEQYNLDLSDRRAASVVAYLASQGIDGATLVARGFGKTKPIVANPYDPQNRRVEIIIR